MQYFSSVYWFIELVVFSAHLWWCFKGCIYYRQKKFLSSKSQFQPMGSSRTGYQNSRRFWCVIAIIPSDKHIPCAEISPQGRCNTDKHLTYSHKMIFVILYYYLFLKTHAFKNSCDSSKYLLEVGVIRSFQSGNFTEKYCLPSNPCHSADCSPISD